MTACTACGSRSRRWQCAPPGLARFDALVIDAEQLGSRAATWLAELRAQLACPLLLVADEVARR